MNRHTQASLVRRRGWIPFLRGQSGKHRAYPDLGRPPGRLPDAVFVSLARSDDPQNRGRRHSGGHLPRLWFHTTKNRATAQGRPNLTASTLAWCRCRRFGSGHHHRHSETWRCPYRALCRWIPMGCSQCRRKDCPKLQSFGDGVERSGQGRQLPLQQALWRRQARRQVHRLAGWLQAGSSDRHRRIETQSVGTSSTERTGSSRVIALVTPQLISRTTLQQL